MDNSDTGRHNIDNQKDNQHGCHSKTRRGGGGCLRTHVLMRNDESFSSTLYKVPTTCNPGDTCILLSYGERERERERERESR